MRTLAYLWQATRNRSCTAKYLPVQTANGNGTAMCMSPEEPPYITPLLGRGVEGRGETASTCAVGAAACEGHGLGPTRGTATGCCVGCGVVPLSLPYPVWAVESGPW